MALTYDIVREIFTYNPETGILRWKAHRGRVSCGSIAGSLDEKGYMRVMIDGHHYRSHRIIWLYMTGELPVFDIDHKDTDRSNNKWNNLRPATKSQNASNYMRKSGTRGISFHKATQKWTASIKHSAKQMHLGLFASKSDAMICYNYHAAYLFGAFAKFNLISEYGHD